MNIDENNSCYLKINENNCYCVTTQLYDADDVNILVHADMDTDCPGYCHVFTIHS